MLSAHIASFFKLIGAQLEETSRGIPSIHHFHNVQCGIANILSLLEYNNNVLEKADQLATELPVISPATIRSPRRVGMEISVKTPIASTLLMRR
jgi:hypothetical protein